MNTTSHASPAVPETRPAITVKDRGVSHCSDH